jgi:hypothetical protein
MIRRDPACRHRTHRDGGRKQKGSVRVPSKRLANRAVVSHCGGCLAGARTGTYNLELVATPMEFDSPALCYKVIALITIVNWSLPWGSRICPWILGATLRRFSRALVGLRIGAKTI